MNRASGTPTSSTSNLQIQQRLESTTQYGLIAEEVAEVDPGLVVRGRYGEIMAVHDEQITNMLLHEFLKSQRTVEELQATVAQEIRGGRFLRRSLKSRPGKPKGGVRNLN